MIPFHDILQFIDVLIGSAEKLSRHSGGETAKAARKIREADPRPVLAYQATKTVSFGETPHQGGIMTELGPNNARAYKAILAGRQPQGGGVVGNIATQAIGQAIGNVMAGSVQTMRAPVNRSPTYWGDPSEVQKQNATRDRQKRQLWTDMGRNVGRAGYYPNYGLGAPKAPAPPDPLSLLPQAQQPPAPAAPPVIPGMARPPIVRPPAPGASGPLAPQSVPTPPERRGEVGTAAIRAGQPPGAGAAGRRRSSGRSGRAGSRGLRQRGLDCHLGGATGRSRGPANHGRDGNRHAVGEAD